MKPIELILSEEEKIALKEVLNKHPLPYMRERASALLQIASGESGLYVAKHGLLKKRRKHTIYDWVNAYKQGGIEALYMKAGRGRKPAFSPSKSK